ncbi:hypothetical protein [Methanobacterium formicicum]|uniref:Uncharacterized protein n=1 Tax=Methanobacterium formicicum TaxID=2162 RepID=A0A843AIZ8_METFO|nr:hypothetical protein [Methanobacterium formicicum]MBF4473918.1 hypothetical protein [Methanobacterium formicicum]
MVDEERKRIFEDYNKRWAELFNSLNLLPSLNKAMPKPSLISEALSQALKPLTETLDKISPDIIIQKFEKSANIMFSNGWWLIPTMPIPFYINLMEVEDINKKTLTNYLVKYYNEDRRLDHIIGRWKLDEFKDCEEIFEDSLWAHKKSKFTLTVPTLTIQVEGTLRRYFNSTYNSNIRGYREELKQQYDQTKKNEKENLSYGDVFDQFTKIQNIKFLDQAIDTFTERFYEKPRNFDDLHRNPLFHGEYENYNTIEMSTKLFLFLDMIHYILTDLEKSKMRINCTINP